jgi:hypothetical protein
VYKYYTIAQQDTFTSASTAWVNDFQEILNYQFDNSSDLYTIQEETLLASGSFVNVTVRINRGINGYTGEKLGDDFKTILFKELDHDVSIGKYYYFDNNYWLTYNTEKIKNLACSVTVRRCNNILKWMSDSGEILQDYVSIEYKTNNPRNDVPNTNPVMPGGYMRIYTQLNSKTSTIKEGQRFLFGRPDNWICLKVFGGGLKNFLNQQTSDNSSAQPLSMEMETSYVNESTDDIILGIADRYKNPISASAIANNIVVTPNDGSILEGNSQIFDVHYYAGSGSVSGSFVFSVYNSNVPLSYYLFTPMTINTFQVTNNGMFLDYPLQILCSGSSGSAIFEVSLMGEW